ncbi:hypothetical protein [Bdellovibrio sp. HCB-162]|uniref:hypothetical protein n=1 Tax=Bdellovibrio sp. HCB-162 TaxID=3394234 RepID=UPI0039BC4108
MQFVNKLMLLVSVFGLSACATIVKSDKIPVKFVGGLERGETKISLPDGQYTALNGRTTVLVSRSKQDIPITVTCNQQTREGVIKTEYDATAGILGNIVFGGIIGMGIDAYNDKTYDPPEIFNVAPLCSTDKPTENIAESSNYPRQPSSYSKNKY